MFLIINDFILIIPEIFIGIILCFFLFFNSFFSINLIKIIFKTWIINYFNFWYSVFILFIYIILLINNSSNFEFIFNNIIVNDPLSYFSKIFIVFTIICFMSVNFNIIKKQKTYSFEFFILIIFSFFSIILISIVNDFIIYYLVLELQALCFYVLAGFLRKSAFSVEAGLKYFVIGAFSSGFFLYGCSLVYGVIGSTNFTVVNIILSDNSTINSFNILQIGLVIILISVFFKISVAPLHMWAPDVYEGSPIFVTVFFVLLPKIVFTIILIRTIFTSFYFFENICSSVLIYSALCSILFGVFNAIKQRKIKKFLIFSSISHVGFILLGMSTIKLFGLFSTIFYVIIYITIAYLVWIMFTHIENKKKDYLRYIDDLKNIFIENKIFIVIIIIVFFSIAGIPPFSGFFAKLFVFFSVTGESNFLLISLFFIVFSIVGTYYYLRVIKIILFERFYEQNTLQSFGFYTTITKKSGIIISLFFFFTILFFIFPGIWLIIVHKITLFFFILMLLIKHRLFLLFFGIVYLFFFIC